MSYRTQYSIENLKLKLSDLRRGVAVGVPVLVKEVEDYIDQLCVKLQSPTASWQEFSAFWPPLCVAAFKRYEAIVFFGAGLSISCGMPLWKQLLSQYFSLDKALTDDDDLAHDPLTLAELAGHYLGSEVLQGILREVMNQPRPFSVGYALLAALRCPVYVTTNYDSLFEQAWRKVNPTELFVVTNDAGLLTKEYQDAPSEGRSVLFKIHGSSDRHDEYLVLTRRDYRIHYRANAKFFGRIKDLLRERHTVFVGFSHRDPEVSRLVEDAIYDYEKTKPKDCLVDPRPQFYSLQFDMRSHTPEVFAARGIVALQPPSVNTAIEHVRDKALAVALVDLLAAKQFDFHSQVSLDAELKETIGRISKEVACGLDALRGHAPDALASLESPAPNCSWLATLLDKLGPLASQGVYLLDEQGNTIEYFVPLGLSLPDRRPKHSLSKRPYFQQAKSFREAFLSDTAASIFNGNSTFFLCMPILRNGQLIGLLFSAAQVGQWKTPVESANELWGKGMSLYLIDSNGVCLFPPRNEFAVDSPAKLIPGETPDANIGYRHERLVELSRRDVLVRHLSRSVVPITQDDDILELARDLKEFSIVAEIPQTQWKVAVSIPVPLGTKA
jgi:hypothetical protein